MSLFTPSFPAPHHLPPNGNGPFKPCHDHKETHSVLARGKTRMSIQARLKTNDCHILPTRQRYTPPIVTRPVQFQHFWTGTCHLAHHENLARHLEVHLALVSLNSEARLRNSDLYKNKTSQTLNSTRTLLVGYSLQCYEVHN